MKNWLAAFAIFAECCLISLSASAQSLLHKQSQLPSRSSEAPSDDTPSKTPFYKNLFEGAKASVSAWQLPLFAVSVLTERQKPGNGMPLPPFNVDNDIAEVWSSNDGKESFGSISPKYYPFLAGTSRLAGMIVLDAIGGQDYAPSSYAKLFRFQQALYFNTVVTHIAKRNFNRHRPDGSDTQSFFSGHTSTAFATSTFLYLEMRDFIDGQTLKGRDLPLLSPAQWKIISFGVFYGWAAYVGYSRIHDNKHYLSDVLVGAASGSLVSYLLYPHNEKSASTSKMKFGIAPMNGGAAGGWSYNF